MYPTTVCPSGRALRCKVARTVNNYNKVLKQLLVRHRLFEKLEFLLQNHSNMSAADFQLIFNQWDREVTWLMLGSEKRCNKFWDGSIEFSLVIGLWIRRIQVYRWIHRYLEGKVEHAGNLYRTCRRLFVPPPHLLTLPQVTAAKEDCKRHLEALWQTAPKLRNEHLCSCLDLARAWGNANAVKTIIKILPSEAKQCHWRSLWRAVQPDRSGAVTQLCVPGPHLMYAS